MESEIKRCEEDIGKAKKLLDDIINDDNVSVEIKEIFKQYVSLAEKHLKNLKKSINIK